MTTVTLQASHPLHDTTSESSFNHLSYPLDSRKATRRQNRSCDQCRKAKRACNARVVLNGSRTSHTNDSSVFLPPDDPCSNCAKTGKQCSFEWLQSQQVSLRTRRDSASRRTAKRKPKQGDFDHARPKYLQTSPTVPTQIISNGRSSVVPLSAEYEWTSPISTWTSSDSNLEWPSNPPEFGDQPLWDDGLLPSAAGLESETSIAEVFPGDTEQEESLVLASSRNSFSSAGIDSSFDPFPSSFQNLPYSESIGRYTSNEDDQADHQHQRKRNRTQMASQCRSSFDTTLSQRLAMSQNNFFITEGLMKIYHDSMENALSCWLTERTCPYTRPKLLPSANSQEEPILQEWNSDWSNRIFKRVFALDRVSSAIGRKPITAAEDAAATRALQLAVISFATQWAQSSQRSRAVFPDTRKSSERDHRAAESVEGTERSFDHSPEFDRTIQESFWHQARQSLQDVAEVESFRVVFAYIVFSLTQKPLQMRMNGSHAASTMPAGSGNTADVLEDLIAFDGPPVFLEQGLRHIHILRNKLEHLEKDLGKTLLDPADRKTVDLLYWLAVMFDTLNSAMHRRPLVVSDEESDNRTQTPAGRNATRVLSAGAAHKKSSRLWDEYFFDQTSPQEQALPLRWPCPYDAAAALLRDAAPIKVLLFRKVTKVQDLISRDIYAEPLEAAIDDALRVYAHWNNLYGQFIGDCIANHNSLPARIQSWYICLTGHWHLATLILADTVEWIDKRHLAVESRRISRMESQFVLKFRQCNSRAISDLARCSSPSEDAFAKHFSDEFHHAVNEGALLTEPWTAVLIRSFAKAGALLLEEHGRAIDAGMFESNEARSPLTRCKDCIKALWYLGKKSDIALLVSEALSKALGNSVSQPPAESMSSQSRIGGLWQEVPDFDPAFGFTDSLDDPALDGGGLFDGLA